MTTQYITIYDTFLSKISDYSVLGMTQADVETQLEKYLLSAIPRFRFCKTDLTDRDSTLKRFNNTLTDYEIEILSKLMIVEYMNPKIVSSELMKQALGDKDFAIYSQANHLKELLNLRKELRSEVSKMINDYTYSIADFDKDLK